MHAESKYDMQAESKYDMQAESKHNMQAYIQMMQHIGNKQRNTQKNKQRLGSTCLGNPQQSRQLSHAREKRTESPPIYLSHKGKEYQKTYQRKEQGLATRESRYGSRLRKGKVLAPLAPIVLDGIHLCLFLSKGCVLCLCLYVNECKRNTGKRRNIYKCARSSPAT